jgi:hypothetical protein
MIESMMGFSHTAENPIRKATTHPSTIEDGVHRYLSFKQKGALWLKCPFFLSFLLSTITDK